MKEGDKVGIRVNKVKKIVNKSRREIIKGWEVKIGMSQNGSREVKIEIKGGSMWHKWNTRYLTCMEGLKRVLAMTCDHIKRMRLML